jgi:hypothetical protein
MLTTVTHSLISFNTNNHVISEYLSVSNERFRGILWFLPPTTYNRRNKSETLYKVALNTNILIQNN